MDPDDDDDTIISIGQRLAYFVNRVQTTEENDE
jgi:hypothetical protein